MFHEQRHDVPETPAALREEYERELAALIEERGVGEAAAETGVDRETLAALVDGESPTMDFEAAAAVAALAEDAPEAETIVEMACEHLLLGMSTAVLDVDTIAGDVDMDGKEVQQKLERRAPMTFGEFVTLQHYIVSSER